LASIYLASPQLVTKAFNRQCIWAYHIQPASWTQYLFWDWVRHPNVNWQTFPVKKSYIRFTAYQLNCYFRLHHNSSIAAVCKPLITQKEKAQRFLTHPLLSLTLSGLASYLEWLHCNMEWETQSETSQGIKRWTSKTMFQLTLDIDSHWEWG
jgi:hypothetical protein